MTVHNGAYLFFLLFSFQSSFFLWTTLSLFLLFFFAFIFTSLIAHICSSVIENECSALRFLLFKQGTLFAAARGLYHRFSASPLTDQATCEGLYRNLNNG